MPRFPENKPELAAREGSWAKRTSGRVIACIDIGTNSFHMIVCKADKSRKEFEVITRVKEVAPFFRRSLGAHFIDQQALEKAKSILASMQTHALERGATHISAVATSAVRESRNGSDALEQIRQELSLEAVMISGKEEARLIYLGVLHSMPNLNDRFAIVDIGGGSTEIISGDRENTYFSESYKLGAARLTLRFFKKGRITRENIKSLHEEVLGMLRPAAARVDAEGGFESLIGTSGTIQALARLDRVQCGKQTDPLHGWKLSRARLSEIVDYLEECSVNAKRIKGVTPDRSQTILAGSIVLLETMRCLGAEELAVSTSALREGVVVDRFLQTGWLEGQMVSHTDPRSKSVHQLLEKYEGDFHHAQQVAMMAKVLFEETRGIIHEHEEDAGHILWSASILHDIGTFIGRNGHHKHSHYLIRHAGLLGHSEDEIAAIASVARYHRGSLPKLAHEAWSELPERMRQLVLDLSAMLRVAEALDRSHMQVIEKLQVLASPINIMKNGNSSKRVLSLVPSIRAGESLTAETWAFKQKKSMFEKNFSVKLDLLLGASDLAQQDLTLC